MPRLNDRKFGLSLESLEGRNLQSVLSLGGSQASDPPVTQNPAVIVQNSQQLGANLSAANYHGIVGFLGQ
jgi:hypothetical protein